MDGRGISQVGVGSVSVACPTAVQRGDQGNELAHFPDAGAKCVRSQDSSDSAFHGTRLATPLQAAVSSEYRSDCEASTALATDPPPPVLVTSGETEPDALLLQDRLPPVHERVYAHGSAGVSNPLSHCARPRGGAGIESVNSSSRKNTSPKVCGTPLMLAMRNRTGTNVGANYIPDAKDVVRRTLDSSTAGTANDSFTIESSSMPGTASRGTLGGASALSTVEGHQGTSTAGAGAFSGFDFDGTGKEKELRQAKRPLSASAVVFVDPQTSARSYSSAGAEVEPVVSSFNHRSSQEYDPFRPSPYRGWHTGGYNRTHLTPLNVKKVNIGISHISSANCRPPAPSTHNSLVCHSDCFGCEAPSVAGDSASTRCTSTASRSKSSPGGAAGRHPFVNSYGPTFSAPRAPGGSGCLLRSAGAEGGATLSASDRHANGAESCEVFRAADSRQDDGGTSSATNAMSLNTGPTVPVPTGRPIDAGENAARGKLSPSRDEMHARNAGRGKGQGRTGGRGDSPGVVPVEQVAGSEKVYGARRNSASSRVNSGPRAPLDRAWRRALAGMDRVRDACAYSFPSDVWSVGIVLFELATLQHPFPSGLSCGLDDEDVLQLLQESLGDGRRSYEFRDFLFACLRVRPSRRATAAELLLHPWLLEGMATLDCFRRYSAFLCATGGT